MKISDYIRWLLSVILIGIIFKHAHWSIGLFAILVLCEREMTVFTLRIQRQNMKSSMDELDEALKKPSAKSTSRETP